MQKLEAKVSRVQSYENLNIVSFDISGVTLKMMSLELFEEVKIDTLVVLNIKATSVAIAKNISGDLSYSNKLSSKIIAIENGELLSSIELKCASFSFESIITKESSLNMNLKVGDEVTALIKANEISISEIISC